MVRRGKCCVTGDPVCLALNAQSVVKRLMDDEVPWRESGSMVQAHRGMKSAIWLPLFNDLADPRIVSRIAVAAEEAGWHGLFVWDHML